jgi:Asp-tRNA(Asn)/Glu-tRNA(Gln) amidotransferase B subunit
MAESSMTPLESFLVLHTKTVNFLMGQVMRATGGKANPEMVKRLIVEKLNG